MKAIKTSFIFLLFTAFSSHSQFPSTVSYKLCSEIPKAKNIGDTVVVFNCMKSGDEYVLKKIDRKGRYKYKNLSTWRDRSFVSYDTNNMVKSYSYKYNSGLWGGSGKGFFIIHYYANGNIKDYAHVQYYKSGELCLYSSLANKESNPRLIPNECYFLYKKRNKVLMSKKYLVGKKEIKKELKKSTLELKESMIQDLPYKLYYLKPKIE